MELDDVQKSLDTKELKTNFETLVFRFEVFREIESVGALENHYLPKIEKFANKVDELYANNLDMRDCIIEFDKNIS